jgi:hypothetical protein
MKVKTFRLAIFAVLICLLVQIETNFAQSPTAKPFDRGSLNDKRKTVVQPAYPPSIKAGNEKNVVVNVIVDEKGDVIEAKAVEGDAILREMSVAAARKTKFAPYLVNGKAVKSSGFLSFGFARASTAKGKDNAKTDDTMTTDDFDKIWGNITDKDIDKVVAQNKAADADRTAAKDLFEKGKYKEAIATMTKVIDSHSTGLLPDVEMFELRSQAYI